MLESIKYTNALPECDAFHRFYETTGWNEQNRKTREQLFAAIKNSWYFISVYADSRLVGCGRVISDGFLHAFITEMIVLEKFQGRGIGREILKRLVHQAIDQDIKDIQLFCAKDKEAFYLKNGFEKRPDNAPGMQYIAMPSIDNTPSRVYK